jgi:hypothetical protein
MILKEVNVPVSAQLSFNPVSKKSIHSEPSTYEAGVLFTRPHSIKAITKHPGYTDGNPFTQDTSYLQQCLLLVSKTNL